MRSKKHIDGYLLQETAMLKSVAVRWLRAAYAANSAHYLT